MTKRENKSMDDLVPPLIALAEANIPTDVQELLVQGDPMRGIPPGALTKAIAAALSSMEAGVEDETCPVCAEPFKTGDMCATDIEMGMCHAACLEGSPVVNLDTGEPFDGPIATYPYEPLEPSPASVPAGARVTDEMVKALKFYRDQWQTNSEGDIGGEPHLIRSWQEPTEELWTDAGRKAHEALAALKGTKP